MVMSRFWHASQFTSLAKGVDSISTQKVWDLDSFGWVGQRSSTWQREALSGPVRR